VARRADGAEDLSTADDALVAGLADVVLGLRGTSGPGPRDATVRPELADLLGGVEDLLARGLDPGLGHRHPAGADLEVDGSGADPDQRRAELLAALGGDPSPFMPWQEEQPTRNRALPLATSLASSCLAASAGVNAA
jgi:hypothetical protein